MLTRSHQNSHLWKHQLLRSSQSNCEDSQNDDKVKLSSRYQKVCHADVGHNDLTIFIFIPNDVDVLGTSM
jgi:hypothetical protein